MARFSKSRGTVAALLMIALAGSSWLLTHEALHAVRGASHRDVAFNPGYQHAKRLQIATARAAMDALGMTTASNNIAMYQADLRLQKVQIEADSIGLERWAAHDTQRRPLLLEIRASLIDFHAALAHASASGTDTAPAPPLLPALKRTESALSNYAASLTEPERQAGPQSTQAGYLFATPVVLWWLLLMILIELAVLAWVLFSPDSSPKVTT